MWKSIKRQKETTQTLSILKANGCFSIFSAGSAPDEVSCDKWSFGISKSVET